MTRANKAKILVPPGKKVCPRCNRVYDLAEFRGAGWCQRCFSLYQQEYRQKQKLSGGEGPAKSDE